MSDLPLSLKYRPKKLSDVIGQPVAIRALTNAFKKDNLHSAFILAGNLGSGKCVSGDTVVFANPSMKRIDSIVKNRIKPINERIIQERGDIGVASYGYYEADAETIGIHTRDGYSLTGTPEHPIRVLDKQGQLVWRSLDNINESDFVAIFRKKISKNNKRTRLFWEFDLEEYLIKRFGDNDTVECKICGKKYGNLCTHLKTHNIAAKIYKEQYQVQTLGSSSWLKKNFKHAYRTCKLPKFYNSRLARFIGYVLAEGGCNGRSIYVVNSNLEINNDVFSIIKSEFGVRPNVTADSRRKNTITTRVNSIHISEFFCFLNLNKTSAHKEVPSVVFSWSKNLLSQFLMAYFEGDGGVDGDSVRCCSKSKKLLQQIQIILLSFGIISHLRQVKKACTNCCKKRKETYYSLGIYSDNILLFAEGIGFFSSEKRKSLKDLVKKTRKHDRNPNLDIIPFLQDRLINIKRQLPIDKGGHIKVKDRWARSPRSDWIHAGQDITYAGLARAFCYFDQLSLIMSEDPKNKDLIDRIELLLLELMEMKKNYFFFSPVVKKTKSRSNVYDVCKEGADKSFITNGFISHNTSVARIIAATENCTGAGFDPCGECANCKAIFNGQSIDVKEIDAASHRGIDDMRNLKKDCQYHPLNCHTKYFIIDECHSLTGHAAEAALKMIEEPPAHVRFVLCTTDPHLIKDTILSRCIFLKFNKVSWIDMHQHLINVAKQENIEAEDAVFQISAKVANGSVRNALQNLQSIAAYAGDAKLTVKDAENILGIPDSRLYFEFIEAASKINVYKGISIITELLKDGREAKVVVSGIESHLRNLMLILTCRKKMDTFGFTETEIKRYEHQIANLGDSQDKIELILAWLKLLYDINRGLILNLDPQMLLERYLIEAVVSKKKLEAIS